MTHTPTPIPKEQIREKLVEHFRGLARYWANVPNQTTEEQLTGLIHSILTTFDGGSLEFPAFDLVARPCPEDKQYFIDQGEDWIENGTVINDDCQLHELLHKRAEAGDSR